MSVRSVRWLALLLCPLTLSCNLLTPLIFIGEHKKQVAAEFDKLAGRRVAVLVWVDASTLFDYPHARFELASYVADKLAAETGRREMNTDVVDPREVEGFLQRNPVARIDPQALGRQFNADYVVYLEVLDFQIRDPEQPQFLRGVINASVSVRDMGADPDQLQRYELMPVRCRYPEHGPVILGATNSPLIREGAYRRFAELVARKFYEYTVDL